LVGVVPTGVRPFNYPILHLNWRDGCYEGGESLAS